MSKAQKSKGKGKVAGRIAPKQKHDVSALSRQERQAQRAEEQANIYRIAAARAAAQYTRDPQTDPPTEVRQVRPLIDQFNYLMKAGDYQVAMDVLHRPVDARVRHSPITLLRWLFNTIDAQVFLPVVQQVLTPAAAQQLDAQQVTDAFDLFSLVLQARDQHQTMLDYGLRLLPVFEERGEVAAVATVLTIIATAYVNLGQTQTALQYQQQAAELATQQEDWRMQMAAAVRMANLSKRLRQERQEQDYIAEVERIIASGAGNEARLRRTVEAINLYQSVSDQLRTAGYRQQALRLAAHVNLERMDADDLGVVANSFYDIGEYEAALLFYQARVARAEAAGDTALAIRWQERIVETYQQLDRAEDALDAIKRTLTLAEQAGDVEFIHRLLVDVVLGSTALGQNVEAIPYMVRLYPLLERDAERHLKMMVMMLLIDAYEQAGQPAEAEFHRQRLIGLLDSLSLPVRKELLHVAIHQLADDEQYATALAHLPLLADVATRTNDERMLAETNLHFAQTYARTGQYNAAIAALQQVYAYGLPLGDKQGASFLSLVADLQRKLKQYDLAAATYEQALTRAREIHDFSLEPIIFDHMALMYEELGNRAKADEYRRKAIRAQRDADEEAGQHVIRQRFFEVD
jgi:tetratricopeptide (TPR) repeat protein